MTENTVTLEQVLQMIEAGDREGLLATAHNHYIEDDSIRERATRAALKLNPDEAVVALVKGLGPDTTCPLCTRLLRELKSAAFDAIRAFGESEKSKHCKYEIAKALGIINDSRGYDVLIPRIDAALQEYSNHFELENIMRALAALGGQPIFEPALRVLQSDLSRCCYDAKDIVAVKNAAVQAIAASSREEGVMPILEYITAHSSKGNITDAVQALCGLLLIHPRSIPACRPQLEHLPRHQDFRKHYDGKMRHLAPYPSHGDEYHYTDSGVKQLRSILADLPPEE